MAEISKIQPFGSSTQYDLRDTSKLPLSGGTLTGALNTANGTWNKIGDDSQIGDINEAGTLGLQGLNGNTALRFTTYNQSTKTTGGKITWDGSKFIITGIVDTSISGNAATATKATQDGSGNTITSTYVKKSGDTMTGDLVIDKSTPILRLKGRENGSHLQFYASDNTHRANISWIGNCDSNAYLQIKPYNGCHIVIDGTLRPQTDLTYSLGTSTYRWNNIYSNVLRLQGAASNPSTSAGARIEFTYDSDANRYQPVYISYTPNDSYRAPAGLKIMGNGTTNDSSPAWLEIEGNTYGKEFISTNANAFRMVYGNYGSFWRNDGTNTYLLLTNSNDQYGNYNDLRPFYVNNNTGYCIMNGRATAAVQDSNGNTINTTYLKMKTDGGLGGISGNGTYDYCTIATFDTNANYMNNPITLEVSGRGIPFTTLQIQFQNSGNVDPGLSYFVSNFSNRFYIKKTDTNLWTLYGYYTEKWGSLYVHRISGNGSGRCTLALANLETLPEGCTQVSYGGYVSYATKASQDENGNTISSKYVTLDTAQTITGTKTFSNNISIGADLNIGTSAAGGKLNGAATDGGINSILIGNDAWIGDCNAAGMIGIRPNQAGITVSGFYFYNTDKSQIGQLYADNTNIIINKNSTPKTTYTYNLGTSSLKWKTAYIGAFTIGGGAADSAESKIISSNSTFYISRPANYSIIFREGTVNKIKIDTSNNFIPETNNTLSVGTSSYKWADMYATTFHGALDGNASSATKLATARSLKTKLDSTTAVTFDGSAAQDAIPVTGTLPIANGGTGATTAPAALNNLSAWNIGLGGTAIANNTDLNTLTTIGNYFCSTTASAKTLTNTPWGSSSPRAVAFILKVVSSLGDSTKYLRQELYVYNSNVCFVRNSTNTGSSWTNWAPERNVIYKATTISDNTPASLFFQVLQTDNNILNDTAYIKVYDDHDTANYGTNMVIRCAGNMFIGGGESPSSLYDTIGVNNTGENAYFTADSNAYIYSNCNTIANRTGIMISTTGSIVPKKAETDNNNASLLGTLASSWKGLNLAAQSSSNETDCCIQFNADSTTKSRIGGSTAGGIGIYAPSGIYLRPSLTATDIGLIIQNDKTIVPGATYTHNLGTDSLRYKTAYIGAFTIGSGANDSVESKTISSNSTMYINRASSCSIIFRENSTNKLRIDTSNSFRPETNNTLSIGTSDYKWANMYATTFHGALDGNAATATKLATARTISLTGSVTGSASFDGSGNISISTTTNHNHDSNYVNVTGDTMTGMLINTFDGNSTARHFTNLAFYENNASSYTGTIKIKLPNTTSNCVMMMCRIMIFDYNSNSGCDLLVSGYTYNDGKWYNYAACPQGTFTKGVRLAYDGTNYCILLGTTGSNWNYSKIVLTDVWSGYQLQPSTGYSISLITSESGYTITATVTTHLRAGQIWGAVWNDYAEFRKDNLKEIQEPGRCVYEVGDGTLALTTERLKRGCEIISDTFGFAIGQDEENGYNTPIASNGRVLAYPYESIEEFSAHIGWPVCSGPNGTVSIMTEEEEEKYSSRIIGTISEIPTYEVWGTGNVQVNGRIWIRIR